MQNDEDDKAGSDASDSEGLHDDTRPVSAADIAKFLGPAECVKLAEELMDMFGLQPKPDEDSESECTPGTSSGRIHAETIVQSPTPPITDAASLSKSPTPPTTGPASSSKTPTTPIRRRAAKSKAPITPITGPATTSKAIPAASTQGDNRGAGDAQRETMAASSGRDDPDTTAMPAAASTQGDDRGAGDAQLVTMAASSGGDDPDTTTPTTPTGPVATWKVPGYEHELQFHTENTLVHNHPNRFMLLAEALRTGQTPASSSSSASSPDKIRIRVQSRQSGVTGVMWNASKQRWKARWRKDGQPHERQFTVGKFRAGCTSEEEACKKALSAAIACRKEHAGASERLRLNPEARGVYWYAGKKYRVTFCGRKVDFTPTDDSEEARQEAFRLAKARRLAWEKELLEVVISKP